MFDINTISKRYFEITINEKIRLEVEPPTIKTLKKIIALSKSLDEEVMDDLVNAVKLVLDKNRSGYVVATDIVEELNLDEISQILSKYFEWLEATKGSPN